MSKKKLARIECTINGRIVYIGEIQFSPADLAEEILPSNLLNYGTDEYQDLLGKIESAIMKVHGVTHVLHSCVSDKQMTFSRYLSGK